MRTLVIGLFVISLAGAAVAEKLKIPTAPRPNAEAKLLDNTGKQMGDASFVQTPTGVLIHIDATGLAAGKHGLHIHATGNCEDHDHFKNAGGHLMNEGETHGLFSKKPHAGDLPNLIAGKDGTAHADFFTSLFTVDKNAKGLALRDNDGSALVIHATTDDYLTDPTGNSGDRIACGVIH